MTKLLKILLIIFFVLIVATIVVTFKTKVTPSPTPTATLTPKASKAEMTFALAGDAMFGRAVYSYFHDDLKKVFVNFSPNPFENKDLAMLNLEGPIMESEFTPNTDPDNLIMEFPKQTLDVLKWLNLDSVSLANNHTSNQGAAALNYTREELQKISIIPIGDPQNSTANGGELIHNFQKESLNISVVAVNILANTPDLTAIIQEAKNKKTLVIIFPHWGGEYGPIHNQTQENLAHNWIEAGADLVIGSHPHVIQDAETYQGRPIIYSMGNFVFDQTFSKETQTGLIVTGKIKNDQMSLGFVPIRGVHLRIEPLVDEEKAQIIAPIQKGLGFGENDSIIYNLK